MERDFPNCDLWEMGWLMVGDEKYPLLMLAPFWPNNQGLLELACVVTGGYDQPQPQAGESAILYVDGLEWTGTLGEGKWGSSRPPIKAASLILTNIEKVKLPKPKSDLRSRLEDNHCEVGQWPAWTRNVKIPRWLHMFKEKKS